MLQDEEPAESSNYFSDMHTQPQDVGSVNAVPSSNDEASAAAFFDKLSGP